MAVRDVLKFIKLGLLFIISYGSKRIGQIVAAKFHAFQYKPGPSPKNVVIIGGSFAGLSLAKRLCECLPSGYRIILIEKNTHFHYPFVFPRLSVVEGHEHKAFIPYDEILYSGRKGVPQGIFERRSGTVVDVTRDTVTLASGEALSFAFLAIATGTSSARPSKLVSTDKQGACAELKSLQDQIRKAESIAVVGGGAVGVELVTDIKGWHPDKDVTLVHSRERLMHGYGPRLHECTMGEMQKLGIKVTLGQRPQIRVNDSEKTGENATLAFPNGEEKTFGLVIPCTGQSPNTQFLTSALSNCISRESGRILVARSLQIKLPEGPVDNIFALGDVAESGGPKMGRAATFQGDVVASNIISLIKGKAARSTYQPLAGIEGMIKLTLGKTANALYTEDGSSDALISFNMGHEDGDVEMGWMLVGAKYDEALAMKEQ